MQRTFLFLSMVLSVAWAGESWGQGQGPLSTDIGVSTPTMQKYIEIEHQLGQGLPLILEKIKGTADLVKKNQFQEGRDFLAQAIKEARLDEKVLSKDSHYKEIADYVDSMEDFLTKADEAMEKRQKQTALNNLAKAYNYTKVISGSPVLKLAATEIALGSASRMIEQKDFRSAGLFLQRAIDLITAVQQDPRVQGQELNQLKNEIIITQQQVTMGQLQDEKRLKRFYPGLAAARVNTLNSYYSIWNRNDQPWEMY